MKGLKADQPRMSYTFFTTQIGWCGVVETQNGLRRIFIGYSNRNQLIKHIKEEFGENLIKENPAGKLIEKINRYCSGEKISFSRFKIDWSSLTPFQHKVLKRAMKIPIGNNCSVGYLHCPFKNLMLKRGK